MLKLRMRLKVCKEMKKECKDKMRKLRKERDVMKINHLQHAELI